MSLEDATRVAQITFYAVIAILTVLTFLRAKRGLLSPVNTEYHKKVIERVEDLSKILLDEYDWDSENHWSKRNPIKDVVDSINKEFVEHREAILKAGEFSGIPTHPDYERLKALVQRVKSDPFIPRSIRDKVTDLLENRANVIIQVHLDHLERYKKGLASGQHAEDLDRNYGWVHNRIQEDLRKRGCGIEDIETEVHEIRFSIQNYFERFDPDA